MEHVMKVGSARPCCAGAGVGPDVWLVKNYDPLE